MNNDANLALIISAKDLASDTIKGIKNNVTDMSDQGTASASKFSDSLQQGFRDASKVLAATSASLTLFAKSATDFTEDYVKSSKALGVQIGVSTTDASRLVAAFGRMGIEASSASQMFGIFAKQIVASTNSSKDNQIAMEKLQLSVEATRKDIAATTDEIQKNGDKNGDLAFKLQQLNNTLADEQNQLSKSADAFAKLGISTVDANGTQKDFNTLLSEVADKFKAMPDGIDKSTLAMSLFGRSGKDMIKVLDLGSAGISELEQQADKLGLTLNPTTINAVQNLIKSQKDLKEQTDALKIAVGTATAPVLTDFNQKINDITGALVNTKGPMHSFTVNALAFGGPVAGATSSVAAFAGNVSSIGPKMGAVLVRLGVVGIILAAVGISFYEAYTRAAQFRDALGDLSDHISHVLAPAIALLQAIIPPLLGVFQQLWAFVGQSLVAAFDMLGDSLGRLWQAINPAFVEALKILVALLAGAVIASIVAFVGVLTVLAQALSVAADAFGYLIGWISDFIGWMGTAAIWVGQHVTTIAKWFLYLPLTAASALDSLVGYFTALPSKILGAVGSLGDLLYQSGKDLIDGMIHGITDMFSTLANKVKSAVGNAVSSVKGFLGIHSPSTVFQEIGHNITQGLIVGIQKNASDVADAMTSLGATTISPTLSPSGQAGSMGGASSQSGNGVVINQTNHIYNPYDQTAANAELGWRLANA